jgi:hypothetical protein
MGDESGGGYTSPPPCLIDLTIPLDQEQDDAEIQLFKVDQRVASSRKCTSHCSAGHVDRLVSANTRGAGAGGKIAWTASTTAASGQCFPQHRADVLANESIGSIVWFAIK